MGERRTVTIELLAPIDRVWSVLSTADGRRLEDGRTRIEVLGARAPDRVSWHLAGRSRGVVEWELDDLDELVFARSEWFVTTSHHDGGRRGRARHDDRADEVASWLASHVGVEPLLVRTDPRVPRHQEDRAPRGAGPMLLGAMWLASRPRR